MPVRFLILTLGPLLLVGACYRLATSKPRPVHPPAAVRAQPDDPPARPAPDASRSALDEQCWNVALELQSRLGDDCEVLIRTPYVLAGDLSLAELDEHHQDVVLPTAQALATCYFDALPQTPIQIVLFSSDEAYRAGALRLDGRRMADYYGYYERSQRRLVLSVATGGGTLAHELTHALAHCDFPAMPHWFDEGLAALHEESEFSADGLRIVGVANWRGQFLRQALEQNRLRPLDSLLRDPFGRSGREATDYAHARYLCLYLQDRQLLTHFYRKFRARAAGDPRGAGVLSELLQAGSLADVDADFRQWVRRELMFR